MHVLIIVLYTLKLSISSFLIATFCDQTNFYNVDFIKLLSLCTHNLFCTLLATFEDTRIYTFEDTRIYIISLNHLYIYISPIILGERQKTL